MTLVVIGPVTKDLVIIGEQKYQKVGGATYYQSFVFEKFYKENKELYEEISHKSLILKPKKS